MRADETIRKAAVGKNDLRMLAVVYTELVADKHATISHAITITSEIFLSVGIRNRTASILNIPVPNWRGMRNCSTTGTDKSD